MSADKIDRADVESLVVAEGFDAIGKQLAEDLVEGRFCRRIALSGANMAVEVITEWYRDGDFLELETR